MAETETAAEEAPKKRSKKPLLIGLVLAAVLGGAGFYATWSGMILGGDDAAAHAKETGPSPMTGIAFVPLETMVISLGPDSGSEHLRFTAQVEVVDTAAADVILLAPRILDVLNGYLRAIDTAEIEDPSAMARLRSQMLRRVQMVVGDGRVRDLLITEFVLN